MNIEKTFRDAIETYISEKKVKNLSILCQKAGVDQAGVGVYLRTKEYQGGEKAKKPSRPKNDIYFSAVAKLIETMGGMLVFPWDTVPQSEKLEIENLRNELAKKEGEIIAKQNKIQNLEGQIEGLLKGLSVLQSSIDRQENTSNEDTKGYNLPAGKRGAA